MDGLGGRLFGEQTAQRLQALVQDCQSRALVQDCQSRALVQDCQSSSSMLERRDVINDLCVALFALLLENGAPPPATLAAVPDAVCRARELLHTQQAMLCDMNKRANGVPAQVAEGYEEIASQLCALQAALRQQSLQEEQVLEAVRSSTQIGKTLSEMQGRWHAAMQDMEGLGGPGRSSARGETLSPAPQSTLAAEDDDLPPSVPPQPAKRGRKPGLPTTPNKVAIGNTEKLSTVVQVSRLVDVLESCREVCSELLVTVQQHLPQLTQAVTMHNAMRANISESLLQLYDDVKECHEAVRRLPGEHN